MNHTTITLKNILALCTGVTDMGWEETTVHQYKQGDKVLVNKQATTIDKRVLGKVATVKFCTRNLVVVEFEGNVWVFGLDEVEQVD